VLLFPTGEGVHSAADKAGSALGGAVQSAKDSVKGLAAEAADTAHAAGEGQFNRPGQ
jgi:hypothetical protein